MFSGGAELPSSLGSGRVGIRLIHRRDARTLERLLRENRAWLEPWEATYPGIPGPTPGEVSLRPTIKRMLRQFDEGRGVPFVITYDGAVVGQLSASDVSRGALWSASVGYWIDAGHAGRNITPTAVALAIDYLFATVGLHRVEICIRPENAASLRIVEKLALRYEGRRLRYIHIDGAWRDHDSFAITREEVSGSMVDRLAPPS
ncbi:GNAT family protein [Leucobacter albus]|uniref:GNAT family protein n=1 Tax=Leucobacter albus TaxID=272210 RepID=A0ABW3TLL5_9MICO